MAQGHVRKRGKTWSYVHYMTDPSTGQGKSVWKGGFRTKVEAQRALRDALAAVEYGTFVAPSKLTYRDYVTDTWLPQITVELETSTIESYERNMRVHVLPSIGGIKLQQLGPAKLNNLYRSLGATRANAGQGGGRRHNPGIYHRIEELRALGTSFTAIAISLANEFPDQDPPLTRHAVAAIDRRRQASTQRRRPLSIRTIRYIHTIISRSLKDATKLGLITTNPARNATPPRTPRQKPQKALWTGEQTRQFLTWARDINHRLWPAWAFVATSGDRRGGNLGLRWHDVDLNAGTARLIWTVTCVNHQIVVKPYGKTGTNHEIIIDPGTIDLLRRWRQRRSRSRWRPSAARFIDAHPKFLAAPTPATTIGVWFFHAPTATTSTPNGSAGSSPEPRHATTAKTLSRWSPESPSTHSAMAGPPLPWRPAYP